MAEGTQVNHERQAGWMVKVTLLYLADLSAEGTNVNHERQAGWRVMVTLLYLVDLSGSGEAGQP